jgi:glycine cleavage system transcriptional repressor
MAQWIITAVGPDRPGIVGELAGHLHVGGANLLDSRMLNLRGQFAVVLLMECPDAATGGGAGQDCGAGWPPWVADLPRVGERMGLHLFVAPHGVPAAAAPAGVPYRLKSYSSDQPGIVHRITDLLRGLGVNIEEVETRQESAAFAGTPLFTMELTLTVPATVQVRKLRTDLQALADQLNCDIDLEPA